MMTTDKTTRRWSLAFLAIGCVILSREINAQAPGTEPPITQPPSKTPAPKTEPKAPAAKPNLGAYDEEEEANPITKKKMVPIDEEAPLVSIPKGAYYVRLEELARAAGDVPHPLLREIVVQYVVAFDRLTESGKPPFRVTPIPLYQRDRFPEVFGVFELTDRNEPLKLSSVQFVKIQKIEHYEELLIAQAINLSKPNGEPVVVDLADRLSVAEQLLAAGIYFHDAARDQNKRKGRGWESVRIELVDRLAQVRLERLKLASDRKDWKMVRSYGKRLAGLYPNNTKYLEQVYDARLNEALIAVGASDQPADLELARESLAEFESQFPGSKSQVAEQIRDGLRAKAKRLFELAQVAVKTEQKDAARLLKTVELIDPNHPGLRELQGQLKGGYAILVVGVRQLPEQFSPLTARSPSERMATDLIFEPLVEALPEETFGTMYRPSLAESLPSASGMVREFDLVRQTEWSGLSKEYFDSSDVAGTLKLMRQNYRHTWAADGIDWLTDETRVEDRSKIRLGFAVGHPYPLSLLTMKMLPARWLASQNKLPDEPGFSRRPFGTGPYQLDVNSLGGSRPTVFLANPTYGRRPGRLAQPYIREIRMLDVTQQIDPAALFRADQLQMVPDVPTNELIRYTGPEAKLSGKIDVVTAVNNRQIWMLAINHQRQDTQSPALRRGIAYTIDREEILNKVFRAGRTEFHKPLGGPFPVGSWATPRSEVSLRNLNLATAKFTEFAQKNAAANLRLTLPTDDPRARAACEMIRKQLEETAAPIFKLTIELEPISAKDFARRIYQERSYDLAYVPFEYPNDWYSFGLGSLLDSTAGDAGGRNFMRYPPAATNLAREDELFNRQLAETRRFADYQGKLVPQAHELHRRFLDSMPFIPLWQLDRHLVISRSVKVHFDDRSEPVPPKWIAPGEPLTGVSRWRID